MKVLHALRNLALLVARLGLGGIMVLHGWRRWQQLGITSQTGYLRQYGVPHADWATWGAVILELVGGIFLIVGALTPLVALAYLVQQGVTIAYTKWRNGPYLTNGGYEYNVILGLLALIFVVFGAGSVSIDRLFRRSRPATDSDEDVP